MLDSYRDLIDGLLETPSALRSLLGDPVPDDLAPPMVEVLREMEAREIATLRRARSVMRKDAVSLPAIEHEPELEALSGASGSVPGDGRTGQRPEVLPETLLTSFNDHRSELVSLLVNLTLRDWERPVNHEILGETVLSEEIEDHLTWDESIIDRLNSIRA